MDWDRSFRLRLVTDSSESLHASSGYWSVWKHRRSGSSWNTTITSPMHLARLPAVRTTYWCENLKIKVAGFKVGFFLQRASCLSKLWKCFQIIFNRESKGPVSKLFCRELQVCQNVQMFSGKQIASCCHRSCLPSSRILWKGAAGRCSFFVSQKICAFLPHPLLPANVESRTRTNVKNHDSCSPQSTLLLSDMCASQSSPISLLLLVKTNSHKWSHIWMNITWHGWVFDGMVGAFWWYGWVLSDSSE